MDEVAAEMPKYRCHKEVWALKIKAIEYIMVTVTNTVTGEPVAVQQRSGAWIDPADEGYGRFSVNEDYVNKHQPRAGGYYVVYKDGYTSFSPAEAFEDGYTLVT
jgi:predicted metal-dependent peptidase